MTWLFRISLSLLATSCFAQNQDIRDSLHQELRRADTDSLKCEQYFNLGESFYLNNNDSALFYYHKAYELSTENSFKNREAATSIRLALTYQYVDPVKSAEYTMKSITAAENSGYVPYIIQSKRLLALLYRSKNELDEAMNIYQEILALNKSRKDTLEIARSYNDLGIIHMMKAEYESGLDYWKKSLNLKLQSGEITSAAVTMSNIGLYYKDINNFEEAESYIQQSLELSTKVNNFESVAFNLANLAALYGKMGDYEKSVATFERSLKISDSINTYFDKKETLFEYSKILEQKGDYEKALDIYKSYASILSDEYDEANNETIQKLKTQFETEKKEQELVMKDAELEKQAAEKALIERSYQYAVIFIIVVIIALGVILFILRKVRQAKKQVEIQRSLLAEKNKEILDSIQYAKRLQEAILPPLDEVKNAFAGFGILYLPKDIVAGDFYWFEETDTHRFIASADCTGHGVPGAMVSVVCSNALTKSVQEDQITDPGSILDRTREIVIRQFEKSKSNVKDGMDISLLAINKNTGETLWAGAHNPIWIIKKSKNELIEIKGNKQPIGNFESAEPFKTHPINCETGDRLYMFSDGFADQFGGEDQLTRDQGGKKFKTKAFKRKLIETAHKKPQEQISELESTLHKWRGNLEQLDDVCVVVILI